MADSIHLKVVTPSGCKVDKAVRSCTATSKMGEICVLPGHRLLLTSLIAGRMVVEIDKDNRFTFAVDAGFLEAAPSHVNIITDRCFAPSEIDTDRVLNEIIKFEPVLEGLDAESVEGKLLARRLAWARVRLLIAAG